VKKTAAPNTNGMAIASNTPASGMKATGGTGPPSKKKNTATTPTGGNCIAAKKTASAKSGKGTPSKKVRFDLPWLGLCLCTYFTGHQEGDE